MLPNELTFRQFRFSFECMAKKNPLKNALILVIVAIFLVLIANFVLKPQQEKQEKDKDKSTLLFPEIDRQKIVELRLSNPNGLFELKKNAEKDVWSVIHNSQSYPADRSAIDGLLSTLLSSKKENPLENKELAKLGLEPPKFKLLISDGSASNQKEVHLGDDTPVDYLVFARWAHEPNSAFTTTRSLRFGLEKKLSDFRNKKVFDEPKFAEITRVELKTFAQEKKPSEKFVFEKTAQSEWMSQGTVTTKVLEKEIEALVTALQNLSVSGFASDDIKEKDKFGLKNPVASVTLSKLPVGTKATSPQSPNAPTPDSVTWLLGRVENKEESAKSKSTGEKSYKWYFSEVELATTYEVSAAFVDNFKTDLMRFRDKEILTFKIDDVSEFSIGSPKETLQFKKNANMWELRFNSEKSEGVWKKAKTDKVTEALTKLSQLKAQSFIDGANALSYAGLKVPSRTLELKVKDQTLGPVFIGRKIRDGEFALRSPTQSSVAVAEIALDELLPLKLDHFAEPESPVPPTDSATPAAGGGDSAGLKSKGANRVKLEATVKSLTEIKQLPAATVKAGKKYTAEMTLDNGQKMTLELHADKAPYTVSNFIHLARNGFYDGILFHRVEPNFVIQAGDPSSKGKKVSGKAEAESLGLGRGGPGYQFKNEDTGLTHKRGTMAMANAGRDTNGSQFYICIQPATFLDKGYTIFGQVVGGEPAIDSVKVGTAISKVEVFEE